MACVARSSRRRSSTTSRSEARGEQKGELSWGLTVRIHSICLVKNEVDIIAHCLERASRWSDHIYVYDNGSSDGTWETVCSLASDRVIPWRQDALPFRNDLRNKVFNEFVHRSSPGDWWCRLDADEFYIDDPRSWLRGVRPCHHVVWGVAVEYYLTQTDIEKIDFSAEIAEVLPDIRHYRVVNSEPRFFRYRRGLSWDGEQAWPRHMGLAHPDRIPYRHYKYRSPAQIALRLATRRQATLDGETTFGHAVEESWESKISDPKTLEVDQGDETLKIDLRLLPDHRGPLSHRLVKRLMHGLHLWP